MMQDRKWWHQEGKNDYVREVEVPVLNTVYFIVLQDLSDDRLLLQMLKTTFQNLALHWLLCVVSSEPKWIPSGQIWRINIICVTQAVPLHEDFFKKKSLSKVINKDKHKTPPGNRHKMTTFRPVNNLTIFPFKFSLVFYLVKAEGVERFLRWLEEVRKRLFWVLIIKISYN